MCAYAVKIPVNLLRKDLCSGCPCLHDPCTLKYWTERAYVWYNWRTGEMQEPTNDDHELATDEGWGYHTKRPQACIEALG